MASEIMDVFEMTPWDRYAGFAGALTTLVCLGAGLVGCFVNEGSWHARRQFGTKQLFCLRKNAPEPAAPWPTLWSAIVGACCAVTQSSERTLWSATIGASVVLAAVYTVAVGLLVAVIELPALYCHSYSCVKCKDRLIEDTTFHHGWIRASLYLACTPAMLGFKSILLWPGAQLVCLAGLYASNRVAAQTAKKNDAERRGRESTEVLVALKYRINGGGGGGVAYSNLGRDNAHTGAGADSDEDEPTFGTFTL